MINLDTLENFITGMGTDKDKSFFTRFNFSEMSKQQLEDAYRSDWIARKIVDIPAYDATREWRTWSGDPAQVEAISALEEELGIKRKVMAAMQKARLYGGAALLLGVNNNEDMSKELLAEAVGLDALKYVHVVSRWDLTSGPIDYDIKSDNYGLPQFYYRPGDNLTQVHPSRIVRFVGNDVPDPTLSTGWGDSVLQVVKDAVIAAGTVVNCGASLLQEVKVDVIKIPDLTAMISQADYLDRLTKRFGLAAMAKGMYKMLILDKDEEWARVQMNLTGIPDILQMYLMVASGAADIPATRMLGQSPAGLSATGESDIRNYYDKVATEQRTIVEPRLQVLDELLVRSATGNFDPSIDYDWNSLWQMDDEKKATVAVSQANAHKVDVDAAAIPIEILRDARLNQLLETDFYPGLQQILDDFGDLDAALAAQKAEEAAQQAAALAAAGGQPVPPGGKVPPTGPKVPPVKGGKVPPAAAAKAPAKGAPVGRARTFGKKAPPGRGAKATGDTGAMFARIRDARLARRDLGLTDATPRTLYVSRKVTNAEDVVTWAKSVGFTNILPESELHVTIVYSRLPVDWAKTPEDERGGVYIGKGGMRMLDVFGPVDNQVVALLFSSSALSARHREIYDATQGSWDWPEYQPHITISVGTPPANLRSIEPYRGELMFGPEMFEEIVRGSEDHAAFPFDYSEQQPRDPDGKFGSGGGGLAAGTTPTTAASRLKDQFKAFTGSDKFKAVMGHIASKEAASFALQSLVSHGTGLDASTWHLNEQVIDHTINHYAEIAHVTKMQAVGFMKKAVGGLIKSRQPAHADNIAWRDEEDEVLKFLLELQQHLEGMPSEDPPAD